MRSLFKKGMRLILKGITSYQVLEFILKARKPFKNNPDYYPKKILVKRGRSTSFETRYVRRNRPNRRNKIRLSSKGNVGFKAARIFKTYLGKTYKHKGTGFYWVPKESDFVKVICKKMGKIPKGGSNDEGMRKRTFLGVLEQYIDASKIVGFKEQRARFVKLLPELIHNPDAIYEGIKGNDKGKIAFVKYMKNKHPTWIGIQLERHRNKEEHFNDNKEISPLSHIVKTELTKNWKKRYRQIWP